MKSILLILFGVGFLGSCGEYLPSGLEIGSKATSVFIKGKNVSVPLIESNSVKPVKEYPHPGFSPMGLPGRF